MSDKKPIPATTAKPAAKPVAKPVAAPAPKAAPPAPKATEAPEAATEGKAKKTYADEIPAFVYGDGEKPGTSAEGCTEQNTGTILMVTDPEKPKKGLRPIDLDKYDFPRTKEGRLAFLDYQIAKIEWKRSRILNKGDDSAKRRAKYDKMKAAIEALEKELGIKS